MANRRGKVERVTDFIFLGSKITADNEYSHKIKIHVLIGRTDAEAEAPTLWPPDVKTQLTRTDPNAGKD